MRDEWDYRAARPGLLPDMSVRYPAERLKEGSDQYLDHAFHFVGSMAGKNVLEVGSGTGRFTERLLPNASELTCVELSDRMIAHMRARISDAHLDSSRLKIVPG
jgi:16S rRNA A1518/A1519 N6-dimethyltransferase RsmA/KsgA/DIM1 with predicted DNA glycosylase/AP lyase activity